MRLPLLSWFMILCGTPITLILMMNYLPLAGPGKPQFVFFSCLMECISTGIYGGCLIGLLCSRLFRFNLGTNWNEIALIRITSSGSILVLHPISLLFIDLKSAPAIWMSVAWLIAVIDLRINWKLLTVDRPNELKREHSVDGLP
jgi:hypothetical protein